MYKNSLKIIEIISYIRAFWLGYMISILFLKFIGLNDVDIGIFHSIMGLFIFLLEIPTGSFADKKSYKLSIVLSYLFLSLAFISFVLAVFLGKFVIIYFTALFFALSNSFSSGAIQSYIFNIFKFENNLDKYLEFNSKISRNSKILQGIAILIGAFLYDFLEYLPYLIQFVFVFFAFVLSLFLKQEPKQENEKIELGGIKGSLKIFFSNKFFLFFLIFIVIATMPFEYFHHVINQSIFEELGFGVKQIGFLGFCSYLLGGLLIHLAPKIWTKLGEYYSYVFLIILNIIIGVGFSLSNNYFYIIFLSSIIYFIRETTGLFIDNSLQFRIKDNSKRATLLSIFNMLGNLPTKFMFIIFGIIFFGFSYLNILIILNIIFGITSLFYLIIFLKNKLKYK